MPRELPKGVQKRDKRWYAQCTVDGKIKYGPRRDTVEEAVEDHAKMEADQKAAKLERIKAKAAARAAVRDTHADHLARNMEVYGGSRDKDGLARALVEKVMRSCPTHGFANGVPYSIDGHVYSKANDCGFDPEEDAELADPVPTLAIELKSTQSLIPHHGSMRNPLVQFQDIHYGGKAATLVVMLYVPKGITEATDEAIAQCSFWYEVAKDFKPTHGVKRYSLHGGKAAKRRLRRLPATLRTEYERHAARDAPLPPYGDRRRAFAQAKHALHQRGIDAFEDQVARPLGARLVPTPDVCEGEPGRTTLFSPDGTRRVVQFGVVRVHDGKAGFQARMYRRDGSIPKEGGGSTQKTRPFSVEDGVDLFVFLRLDDDGTLAEYWSATVQDLLGAGPLERLITDAVGGVGGVQTLSVHPRPEDKAHLGDVVANGDQDAMAVRTRQWIRALGPIVDPATAAALRLSAKAERAERAALAAAEAAKAAAQAPLDDDDQGGAPYVFHWLEPIDDATAAARGYKGVITLVDADDREPRATTANSGESVKRRRVGALSE